MNSYIVTMYEYNNLINMSEESVTDRHQATFYIYCPYYGDVVKELPDKVSDFCLVINDGIYKGIKNKWVKVDNHIFYDVKGKCFVVLDKDNKLIDAITFEPVVGDILIDGALGRVYLYDGDGWDYDKRGSLKGEKGEPGIPVTTAIMIDDSANLLDGIRTVFANPNNKTITVILPMSKCLMHETPDWTVCNSPMITIVNVSNKGYVKVLPNNGDAIHREITLNPRNSVTLQSYGGVWYIISTA